MFGAIIRFFFANGFVGGGEKRDYVATLRDYYGPMYCWLPLQPTTKSPFAKGGFWGNVKVWDLSLSLRPEGRLRREGLLHRQRRFVIPTLRERPCKNKISCRPLGATFCFLQTAYKQVCAVCRKNKGLRLYRSPTTNFVLCGETGIRTLDTRRYNGFRDRPDRPLRHLSNRFSSVFRTFERAKITKKTKIKRRKSKKMIFADFLWHINPYAEV